MSKSRTLATHVDGVDGDGQPFHLAPGDEVPGKLAEFVTNPAVYEGAERPAHSPEDHRPDATAVDYGLDEGVDLADVVGEPGDEFDAMDRAALEAEADARDVAYTSSQKDDTLRKNLRADRDSQ